MIFNQFFLTLLKISKILMTHLYFLTSNCHENFGVTSKYPPMIFHKLKSSISSMTNSLGCHQLYCQSHILALIKHFIFNKSTDLSILIKIFQNNSLGQFGPEKYFLRFYTKGPIGT